MDKPRRVRKGKPAAAPRRKATKSQSFELAFGQNGVRVEPTAAEVSAAEKGAQIKRELDYQRAHRLKLATSPGKAGPLPQQTSLF